MAQAMASMAGLRGSSQAVLEGSLQFGGSTRLNGGRGAPARQVVPGIRASAREAETAGEAQSGRRAVLGILAAGLAGGSFAKAALAEARSIKVGPPPAPSGGLRKFP